MADSNFDNVPDSTDWLSTPLSGLSAVEAALRCQVCKDFYKTPMLTSCCHTFCSLCIRRALSNDGKCPLCRALDQESKLRSNWSMEEIVESFIKARKETLQFAKTAGKQTFAGSSSPKRKLEEDSAPTEQQPETKRLRSSARLSKTRTGGATTAMVIEDHDDTRLAEEDDDEAEDATFTPEDGLVPCPVCQTRMKQWQVFRHLDTCSGPQPQQNRSVRASSSRTPTPNNTRGGSMSRPTPAPERLPVINYSMLKDSALRKKMLELGLSTNGSRLQLEKRHREWITLWNANCDSVRPKRRAELLHDLDVWERTQGARAPVAIARPGAAVKDKEFDGAAWAAKHDTSFKDLIANARKSRAQAKQKSEEAAAEAAPGNRSATAAGPGASSKAPTAMIDLTEPTAATIQTPVAENNESVEERRRFPEPNLLEKGDLAAKPQPPSSAYYLQDGFSEQQMPRVGFGAENSQEAR